MQTRITNKIFLCLILLITSVSCIKDKDLYRGKEEGEKEPEHVDPPLAYSTYLYPFNDEVENTTAEITIQMKSDVNTNDITTEIPYLKFNKSWLLMLTQDDCKQSAYCRTWASINGKPVSSSEFAPPIPGELYYDAAQLQAGDLPPTVIPASKTLGSTDGNGNEIRFSITTTLSPEEKWMNATTTIKPGFSGNYYRFYMKSGLVWNNILEMLNYGTGIAFHDVDASDVNNPLDIIKHFSISQDTILKRLNGRGCKLLAEPNGNKTYVTAALQYPDIQTMVAQAGTVQLYPFQVSDDLKGKLLHRVFETPENIKNKIESELQKPISEREAIHIGVHNTDNSWVELLKWVNNTYGKDGDDSVWFPSQEEYYEYNYYRIHGSTNLIQVDKSTFKLTVTLPSGKYFYYPSVSVNLKGIKKEDIAILSSNSVVTGLSYGNYKNNLTLNIDCRKHLIDHATHFVEQYEADKTNKSKKADALYFINMLKESTEKSQLLKRAE